MCFPYSIGNQGILIFNPRKKSMAKRGIKIRFLGGLKSKRKVCSGPRLIHSWCD